MNAKYGSMIPVDQNIPESLCLPQRCIPTSFDRVKEQKNEQRPESNGTIQTGLFHCPKELCDRKFLTFKGLENHTTYGMCHAYKRQEALHDWFEKKYFNKFSAQGQETFGNDPSNRYFATYLTSLSPVCIPESITFVENSIFEANYKIGYALTKSGRGHVTFTKEQKVFTRDLFVQGQQTNQKIIPDLA